MTALLIATPRYRTYVTARGAGADDRALIEQVAEEAAKGLRSDLVVRQLAGVWAEPSTPAQQAFVTRLQQV